MSTNKKPKKLSKNLGNLEIEASRWFDSLYQRLGKLAEFMCDGLLDLETRQADIENPSSDQYNKILSTSVLKFADTVLDRLCLLSKDVIDFSDKFERKFFELYFLLKEREDAARFKNHDRDR